jgi:hypothetical protein
MKDFFVKIAEQTALVLMILGSVLFIRPLAKVNLM